MDKVELTRLGENRRSRNLGKIADGLFELTLKSRNVRVEEEFVEVAVIWELKPQSNEM